MIFFRPIMLIQISIFWSQLSIDWQLGCFHVLAILSSAAMKIGVYVTFWIRVFVFAGYMHRSSYRSYWIIITALSLIFKEISILFSTLATTIYIPTNSVGVFLNYWSIWMAFHASDWSLEATSSSKPPIRKLGIPGMNFIHCISCSLSS